MIALGTLNLTAGELFVTLQMLVAMRTGKSEFAHIFSFFYFDDAFLIS